MIDGPPKLMFDAVDFDENFVEMPTAMSKIPHRGDPISPNFGCENLTKAIPPETYRLMGDVDARFVEEVFHISQ